MARSAGNVIGAVVVVPDVQSMHASIQSIAVELRYRRAGLGRRLIHAALAQHSAHIRTVGLEVRVDNAAARALYEQLGFRVSRRMRKYYGDGATALEYRASVESVLEAARSSVEGRPASDCAVQA